jgi:hypothetical protein
MYVLDHQHQLQFCYFQNPLDETQPLPIPQQRPVNIKQQKQGHLKVLKDNLEKNGIEALQ